jgi:F-type H+-transporting ATPase subunit epsilon
MYHLFLATPEKVLFDAMVSTLTAPGTLGYLEILTDHAPIITTLTTGKLEVTDKDNKKWTWAISGGFLEMFHNQAAVLADTLELASEIDVKRAELACTRAQNRIKSNDNQIDLLRAQKDLKRAKNRITLACKT